MEQVEKFERRLAYLLSQQDPALRRASMTEIEAMLVDAEVEVGPLDHADPVQFSHDLVEAPAVKELVRLAMERKLSLKDQERPQDLIEVLTYLAPSDGHLA